MSKSIKQLGPHGVDTLEELKEMLERMIEFVDEMATENEGPFSVGGDVTHKGPMYRVLDKHGDTFAYTEYEQSANEIAAALNALAKSCVYCNGIGDLQSCSRCDGTGKN